MSTTLSQIKIIINNRNRLTTTKKMVEHLLQINPEEEIVIIDNDSTFPPLLQWYAEAGNAFEVVSKGNLGHNALWMLGMEKELSQYFVYTDSDIELDPEMPLNWKLQMINLIEKYEINKVGLSIRVDDIPDHYPHKEQVIRDQEGCWQEEVEPEVFRADTDTTFALYRNVGVNMYQSLRVARRGFKSRHTPFYLDFDSLSEEEKYILDNHDPRFLTKYTSQHVEIKKESNE